VFEHVIGQRARINDRVSPVVHPDPLGEQLTAHAVRLALDRIDAQTDPHHHASSVAGTGSNDGCAENLHSPFLR